MQRKTRKINFVSLRKSKCNTLFTDLKQKDDMKCIHFFGKMLQLWNHNFLSVLCLEATEEIFKEELLNDEFRC